VPNLDAVLLTGVSSGERLVLLGAVVYLTAGAVYLALTGLTGSRVPIRRQELGTGPAAALAILGVWAVVVALWPVPAVLRSMRALRRRTLAAEPGPVWRSEVEQPPVAAARAPRPAEPQEEMWPPHQFWAEYWAVLGSGTAGAVVRAAVLVERATAALGEQHPYTYAAWLLLARVAEAGMAARGQASAPAAPDRGEPGDDGIYMPCRPAA
jgi:hypothetical protein